MRSKRKSTLVLFHNKNGCVYLRGPLYFANKIKLKLQLHFLKALYHINLKLLQCIHFSRGIVERLLNEFYTNGH